MAEVALVLLVVGAMAATLRSADEFPAARPAGLIAMAGLVGLIWWSWTEAAAHRAAAEHDRLALPHEATQPGYVTSDTCRACHPAQYATWHATYHRTMTQPATAATIAAPFDDVRLTADGRDYRLRHRDDSFSITRETDGASFQVVMVTGSHHQQRFWVRGGSGNALDLFPFAYLVPERRWVPGEAVFLMPPEIKTDMAPGLWNTNCVACHAVSGAPGVERGKATNTRVAELGIACEACHGPAEQHVLANQNPLHRYAQHRETAGDPTIVNPARLSPHAASEVCGQCHGVAHFREMADWIRHGPRFHPGGPLDADRDLIRYDPNPREPWLRTANQSIPSYMEQHFWADGTVRISGREYTGLLETACAQRGDLSCLSCHRMHGSAPDDQLRTNGDSDDACLACHEGANYGSAHTHHAPDGPGSRCYNCHMPYTTLGLLKAIRSHRIDSPHVATAAASGRPDACSLCHLDKPLAWTAARLTAWYGQPAVTLPDDDRLVAASLLWLLRGDAAEREVAAAAFGWLPARSAAGTSWMAPFLAILLDDPYAAVRFNAYRSLRSLPGFADVDYDYVANPEARRDAARRALQIWRPGDRRDPALLLTSDGTLDFEAVDAQRRRRDDRPVSLAE